MTKSITFRPHHFLCSLGYQGKGYDDAFTANMDKVVANGLHQKGGDDTLITVVNKADIICGPCPHRRGEGCATQDQIDKLDRNHAAALNLVDGETLSWAEVKDRIASKVNKGDLKNLCEGCQWLSYGLCEDALAQLIDSKNGP